MAVARNSSFDKPAAVVRTRSFAQAWNRTNASSVSAFIRSVAYLVAAEVEPVLEERLGVKTQLPEEGCHVAVMTALVQEQMGDQLAPAVTERLAVDVHFVSLAKVGVGPYDEMGSEWVAGAPSLGFDLRPRQEVIGREVWQGLALKIDDRGNPAVVGQHDVG